MMLRPMMPAWFCGFLQEGQAMGGLALNYAHVQALLREQNGRVCGVAVEDLETGRTCELHSKVVINASGAWADDVRRHVNRPARLRRLRGSHLVFPHRLLPVNDVISFLHPRDQRPVFAFAWEGATLVGTTDVDYPAGRWRPTRPSRLKKAII